jgi:hypothetical protein
MSSSVYLLWDPRNGDIRYIGKTIQLAKRLRQHQVGCTTVGKNCRKWEASLVDLGLCCECTVVEDRLTDAEADQQERWWSAYGRQCGWPLTNRTHGGNGAPGHKRIAKTGGFMPHKTAMSFFVSSDILRLLDEMANQERRNRSQMVRELVLREADRRGLKVEVVPEVEEVRHG